jgi:uncharacterized protein
MSGEVGHFELPADNPERARKFYSTIFGWKLNSVPDMEYTMVRTGPVDPKGMPTAPGYIGGGIAKRGGHIAHPVVTIVVDDMSATEKTIEQHGGKILSRKQPIGDGAMGFSGYFQDSEGNIVGLYQNPNR